MALIWSKSGRIGESVALLCVKHKKMSSDHSIRNLNCLNKKDNFETFKFSTSVVGHLLVWKLQLVL